MLPVPKVDRRTAGVVAQQLRELLRVSVPEMTFERDSGDMCEALIAIFARYSEILIDRLNKAPEKNFLAFLDLVGVTPQAARAAQVPLTFYLSNPNILAAVVPAGTQVAADLAKGEQKQVLFETIYELVVAAAQLDSVFVKDGLRDRYIDWRKALPASAPPSGDVAVLPVDMAPPAATLSPRKVCPIPHTIYFALPSMNHWPESSAVRLRFTFDAPEPGALQPRVLEWVLLEPTKDGAESLRVKPDAKLIVETTIRPEIDETDGLSKTGQVLFRDLELRKPFMIQQTVGHWMACRLLTPMDRSAQHKSKSVVHLQQAQITEFVVEMDLNEDGLTPSSVVANTAPVDCTKDFFPFGQKPKFGDTLYISSEAFSNADAEVVLQIELTNPAGSIDSPISPVFANGTRLLWEFWDGNNWIQLGTGGPTILAPRGSRIRFGTDPEEPISSTQGFETRFVDETGAFSKSGSVRFQFDRPPALGTIQGQKGYWIRTRIVAGDYGRDARIEPDPHGRAPVITPATLAPPVIHSLWIGYSIRREERPEAVLTYNDFVWKEEARGTAFTPFVPVNLEGDDNPTAYFGFSLPSKATATPSDIQAALASDTPMPGRSLSVYVTVANTGAGSRSSGASESAPIVATWEYWNGSDWKKWTVRDDTAGLSRSGLIRVLPPSDYKLREEFGLRRYWLRMRPMQSDFDPELQSILPNTTIAREGMTVVNEILGASNGRPDQTFSVAQSPVLDGQQLEICEPSYPPVEQQACIQVEEGEDAIRTVMVAERRQIWVRWHEVPNFYGSGPSDRHYLINRDAGEIRFGDAQNGMIPPVMPGNIRMASYRTGGGMAGNKAALTIKQLRSAVPYVTKVANWVAAEGGGDAEPLPDLQRRGPRLLRHGSRAVTVEDFEDLAMLSTTQVARAKCIPLYDLRADPEMRHRKPGTVSVVLVPRSTETMPTPGAQLLNVVERFLLDSQQPTVDLILVGPEYIVVDVETEITVADINAASETELGVTLALRSFLHPVFGNKDNSGWEFGRLPQKSDVYSVIEDVPGVSHVRNLQLRMRPLQDYAGKSARSLICCGRTTVATTLQE
jgi:hypothetical protein